MHIFAIARVSFFLILSLTAISGSSYSYMNEARATLILRQAFLFTYTSMQKYLLTNEGRQCTVCGQYLTWDNFGNSVKGYKGHTECCKNCTRSKRAKRVGGNPNHHAEHYAKHKSSIIKRAKRYYCEHRSEVLVKAKLYARNNRDKKKLYDAEYRKRNADAIKTRRALHYLNNKNKVREYCKQNALQRRLNESKRIALKKSTDDGTITKTAIITLLKRQKHKCAICKCNIKHRYEIDHIIPLAKNGIHSIINIQLLCQPCNGSKNAKILPGTQLYIDFTNNQSIT